MRQLSFSKWSPGGNTTLLFPASGLATETQTCLAREALDAAVLGGEQAGFYDADSHDLRMAGGEFCVNASRAFGALLALAQDGVGLATTTADITVSGWHSPLHLRVRGHLPVWQVEAQLCLPDCPVLPLEEDVRLVRLPGICHVLVDARKRPLPEDCQAAAAALRQRYDLHREPAVGVVWWRAVADVWDMVPLVSVRDAHTSVLEQACGSGALALALHLAALQPQQTYRIQQPSGSPLDVRLFSQGQKRMAGVDGSVCLLARGTVWLPEAAPALAAELKP